VRASWRSGRRCSPRPAAERDGLRREGFATREYIVYGPEWWLYVLNRMAEHPERVIAALADLDLGAIGG
jgi:proline dehydrogenase